MNELQDTGALVAGAVVKAAGELERLGAPEFIVPGRCNAIAIARVFSGCGWILKCWLVQKSLRLSYVTCTLIAPSSFFPFQVVQREATI